MSKRILGLDLGTNSIGWALTNLDFEKKEGNIQALGTRIIPMSQEVLSKFGAGQSISQTAERTAYRGARRLHQRFLLRRERLHRVLNILEFLPEHYSRAIDFKKHLGQFKKDVEVKINYYPDENGQFRFLYMDAFHEMAKEFATHDQSSKLPFDWTLYYLRKKGLTQQLTKEELSWVLLSFNNKRGYYRLREEELEQDNSKDESYYALKVSDVREAENQRTHGPVWYEVVLENGWIYKRKSETPLFDWVGKTKEFIVTTTFDKKGNLKLDKEGEPKRSFRAVDSEKDWIAIKKKTENELENSGLTVGEFIFQGLLKNPNQKIKGGLVRTIDRKFYKRELEAILETQQRFHPELNDPILLKGCIEELYPKNETHRQNVAKRGFQYLFSSDIIFYQRPLKSKKSSIANCPFELRSYWKEGVRETQPLKVISKSNPIFQEFRIWQFIRNLRIFEREKADQLDIPVTELFLNNDRAYEELYSFLNSRKEIGQKALLQHLKLSDKQYRWNYPEDKAYPCNPTRKIFLSKLEKVKNVDAEQFLNEQNEHQLWHILYSVKDKDEYHRALKSFSRKKDIDTDSFLEQFGKLSAFENDYGSFSEKAIKKLLPLMRQGKFWREEDVPSAVNDRISDIMNRLQMVNFQADRLGSVADDDIPVRLLKSFIEHGANPLSSLSTYQACYAVYNRHSEVGEVRRWTRPSDIEQFLLEFRQHSLRNPIVEQVVTETLRVVKDIWEYHGRGEEGFFDEIHLELGRDMKNSKKKREMISQRMSENENTNERIKSLLEELMEDPSMQGEVRSYSPSHQEILKIFEEGVYENSVDNYREINLEEINKIRKSNKVSKKDIQKYRLWLEQGYVSPYTGNVISLSRLFSTDYQIEHIIPRSRYFDNSFSNKVICESEINELKDNKTAYAFIQEEGGRLVQLSGNRTIKLFSVEDYQQHCKLYFKNSRAKLKVLLSEEVPENFTNRQLTDTRYISTFVRNVLSNIVRKEKEDAVTSVNLVPVNGAITNMLKQQWGLNDKWNEIVAPRFQRLNQLTNSEDYGYWETKINAFRIQVPREMEKGFSKKRIDHRHHALDALIIACVTKDHINYLNSLNSQRVNHKLVSKLRESQTKTIVNRQTGQTTEKNVAGSYHKPWPGFTVDAKEALQTCIVSFKQNTRVLTKSNNRTWQWVEVNGSLKKQLVLQTKGDNKAIRKPLHGETYYGRVHIKREKGEIPLSRAIENWELIEDSRIRNLVGGKAKFYQDNLKLLKKYFKENPIIIDGVKIEKVKVNEVVSGTAARVQLTSEFTRKQLNSITDSGIRKILNNHMLNYKSEAGKENFTLAFSPEGIEDLNENIVALNDGKHHEPIYKVRLYEVGHKYPVGYSGNKRAKYVEAASGTNLYFAIFWDEEKQRRVYETIPLHLVIERRKQNLSPVPEVDAQGNRLLFFLSPNDLVYVPSLEEQYEPGLVDLMNLSEKQIGRIYRMEKTSGKQCYYIPHSVGALIRPYDSESKIGEFGSQNKVEMDHNNQKISDVCLKLKVNRVGVNFVTSGFLQTNLKV